MAMNIMIQGTMSNAGKSLLAAGLCRVYERISGGAQHDLFHQGNAEH